MKQLPESLPAFLWHFIRCQPLAFAFFFIAPCALVLETNVVPYALKLLIDGISEHSDDRTTIFQHVAPALWLGGSAWLSVIAMWRLKEWSESRIMPRFEAQIRMGVLGQVMHQSHAYFADQQAGNLANKIADLPRSARSIVMLIAHPGVATAAVLVVSLALMAVLSPAFALVLGVWVAVHLSVTLYLSAVVHQCAEGNAKDKSVLSGGIVDVLANITSVRLFARRSYELSYVGKKQALEAASNALLIIRTNQLRLFMDLAFLTMLGCMAYFVVVKWQQRQLSTGDVVYVFNMSWAVIMQMWFLGHSLTDLFREVGVARQALELVSAPRDVQNIPNAQPLRINKGQIEFQNVGFHYLRGNNIFENKSLVIEAGQKVGLVGFSGSGKTTFAHLILRFYDVASGRILIDGQDISLVCQDSLRANIAMIPQDASLFHRTLMENIRYARLHASDQDVITASQRAHCHEFISRLPSGYDSLVGERGTKLSGGQRQRIAIARAFLKDAPILILDEATSALDSVTEKHIQTGLHELMQGRTTIVIAHRLSTLSEMDRILVFDQGHVVQDGSHELLLKQGGHYARMWQMQAGGFLPEQIETENAYELQN